jgi:hypothetical protein
LLITYGINHSAKPSCVALLYILSYHILRILALLSASRARRLRTGVFVKGSTIRSLSNKRTLVRCEKLVVDRVGLFVSIEVLRLKSAIITLLAPRTHKTYQPPEHDTHE